MTKIVQCKPKKKTIEHESSPKRCNMFVPVANITEQSTTKSNIYYQQLIYKLKRWKGANEALMLNLVAESSTTLIQNLVLLE